MLYAARLINLKSIVNVASYVRWACHFSSAGLDWPLGMAFMRQVSRNDMVCMTLAAVSIIRDTNDASAPTCRVTGDRGPDADIRLCLAADQMAVFGDTSCKM